VGKEVISACSRRAGPSVGEEKNGVAGGTEEGEKHDGNTQDDQAGSKKRKQSDPVKPNGKRPCQGRRASPLIMKNEASGYGSLQEYCLKLRIIGGDGQGGIKKKKEACRKKEGGAGLFGRNK